MNLQELLDQRNQLVRRYQEKVVQFEAYKEANPFWYFEPSVGEVDEGQRSCLTEWLKAEDIPVKLTGQKDVFASNASVVATFGGNQGGKTTTLAIKSYIMGTGEVPFELEGIYPKEKIPTKFPVHIRIVGVDFKSLMNNVLPCFQYWAPRDYLRNGKWSDSFSSERNTLSLFKGPEIVGTIEFMTNQMEVESFQGPPRHFIGYDEEPRLDVYKENLMRFTTADRLDIMFAMTPTRGMSTWVKEKILDKSELDSGGSIECFKMASVVNKKANLKVLKEILGELDTYEEIKMRLLGEFVSLSGLVYGNLFNRQVHVIEPFEIPKDKMDDYMVIRGIDPHLVKPTVCIELAVDRENTEYVIGTYVGKGDTEQIKADLAERARDRNYRLGWSRCDKSADSTLKSLGDRNIFRELSRGENYIQALFHSEKFLGSINAGVDQIKKLLKPDPNTGKPRLYFFNIPENRLIINAMESLEREISQNEDRKGMRDKISEAKYDAHAALRYIHQSIVNWVPRQEEVPEYEPDNEMVNY